MNISLALVKARQVCSVRRATGDWYVRVPSNLAKLNSHPMSHPCDSYKDAIKWCAQLVARIAVLQKFPELADDENTDRIFGAMTFWQNDNPGASAVEIARFGVRYIETHFKA